MNDPVKIKITFYRNGEKSAPSRLSFRDRSLLLKTLSPHMTTVPGCDYSIVVNATNFSTPNFTGPWIVKLEFYRRMRAAPAGLPPLWKVSPQVVLMKKCTLDKPRGIELGLVLEEAVPILLGLKPGNLV